MNILPCLILAAMVSILAGCASTEPENMSARPWGAPQEWETGLPAGMFEGR